MSAAPRILVAEGNTRARYQALGINGAVTSSQRYAGALAAAFPGVEVDIAHPADEVPRLAGGAAAYAGFVLGGSGLHVYDPSPEVVRQIDLTRTMLEAGVPMLGSCWGLQVAAVAAGGTVARNPRGREVGIARKIALTPAGRAHPLFAGKASVFDNVCIHFDEVTHLPPGAVVLASNAHSAVQAAAFRWGGGVFWGVQYHPEFDLCHMARLYVGYADAMVEQGFFASIEAVEAHAALLETVQANPARRDLAWLIGADDDVLDEAIRCREIQNWMERLVVPTMARRA